MPKVKVGNDNRDGVAGPEHLRRARRRRHAELRLRGQPVHRHGRRRRPVRRRAATATRRWTSATPSATTRATRRPTRTTCAARSCASSRSRTRPAPRAWARPTRIPAGNMFAAGTDKTKPEIFAMGFRNPFTVQADPAHPGTVVVGDYGPDASDQHRHARTGRHHRVEPRDQAGLLRLAAVHGRQLGRQQLLPLHVPERPVRRALRLRRRVDPERVAQPERPDGPAGPGASAPTSGTSARATTRRASASRPARARRSRSRARSTSTTPPTRPTPSGRPTTTAPGSCSTAPRTGGVRPACATTAPRCCA